MNVNVNEVRGLRELDEFLRTLPEQMQRKMLYSSLMTAAKPIMDQAKQNVERQFGGSVHYTGTLAKGITRGRMKKTGLAARVDVKLKRPKNQAKTRKGKVIKPYGDDPFYGRFLEFGTSKMNSKPWLRPAAMAKQDEAGRKLNEALQKQVAKWCKANGVTYKPGTP
ncbi:HK97-gp10 family putative phage morphogenesis protein [Paraburkholderia sp. MM5477-R1]|uniref:HK97-gp10 family putative phage morphogenesis protein n=1 Tax=Paraburkholderia sp. MM5477-R1 TaxID=2991062 RepID=UPI003D225C21